MNLKEKADLYVIKEIDKKYSVDYITSTQQYFSDNELNKIIDYYIQTINDPLIIGSLIIRTTQQEALLNLISTQKDYNELVNLLNSMSKEFIYNQDLIDKRPPFETINKELNKIIENLKFMRLSLVDGKFAVINSNIKFDVSNYKKLKLSKEKITKLDIYGLKPINDLVHAIIKLDNTYQYIEFPKQFEYWAVDVMLANDTSNNINMFPMTVIIEWDVTNETFIIKSILSDIELEILETLEIEQKNEIIEINNTLKNLDYNFELE